MKPQKNQSSIWIEGRRFERPNTHKKTKEELSDEERLKKYIAFLKK